MRVVARGFQVSLSTVQWWVRRAENVRLDRVDWSDRPRVPRTVHRTDAVTEDLVIRLRRELKEQSDLGEFGAPAIQRELTARAHPRVPSIRTIGRILERRGALDGRKRTRHRPPPRGWYLPEIARGHGELDSFDIIEGLKIRQGPLVEVLTGISLLGGLPAAWPTTGITTKFALTALLAHWQRFGLPAYVQFDNDTVFQGAHQHRDVFSRVMRLCLSLQVIPVFAPPRETGFQAAVESFNGRWQSKVWGRFQHASLGALQEQSDRYLRALRQRCATRIESAPLRRPFPSHWELDFATPLRGLLVYIRRTTDHGSVAFLGRHFPVDPNWPHRLVRCEVHLDAQVVRFYALRRRQPDQQPLLAELPYLPINRPFRVTEKS